MKKLNNIILLTGEIQTGKTTTLKKWSESRNDVGGVLMPVVNDKRCFYNIKTKEVFLAEAETDEQDVELIGRFVFSKKAFAKAIDIIKQSVKEDFLVIDEIGPLELRKQQGLYSILLNLLEERNWKRTLIIVVRANCAEELTEFCIQQCKTQIDIPVCTLNDFENVANLAASKEFYKNARKYLKEE